MKYIREINEHGTPDEKLQRAKKTDLITLPEEIDGTNCGNCKFMDLNKKYCTHKDVDQEVTHRMCCALWDADGVEREWKIKSNDNE